MPANKDTTYTTVAARDSFCVHAVSLTQPHRTLCGRRFSGWNIVPANAEGKPKRLNCGRCKLAILKIRVGVQR